MRKFSLVFALFFLLISCHGKKVETKVDTKIPPSPLNEPDKVLFEKAMKDLQKSRFTVARLSLQAMINNYPDSPLLDEAKEKLRGVQEVLAEGVYKVGSFYYQRKSYPAAVARFKEIMTKYPDYSKMPDTLYYLAESLRNNNNEPEAAI